MQHALAEQQSCEPRPQLPKLRFHPVMHLVTGDHVSTLCQSRERYAERVVFGTVNESVQNSCPAGWLAAHIAEAAAAVELIGLRARPLIVRAPLAALTNAYTAEACDSIIKQTRFCPQEFCIEMQDGALAQPHVNSTLHVRALRKRGFRVSLDARKGWNTILDAPMRMMLDSIRINAEKLYKDEELQRKCVIATAAGITVIAERTRWRDADALAALGVHYAITPKADA